ncbi:MAG: hypothetical protein U0T74_03825 [Chitinophagales bacterium]
MNAEYGKLDEIYEEIQRMKSELSTDFTECFNTVTDRNSVCELKTSHQNEVVIVILKKA